MNRVNNQMLLKILLPVLAVLPLLVTSSQIAAEGSDDIVVIANRSIKANSIDAGELKAIFLRKKGTFKSTRVVAVNGKTGSDLRKVFQRGMLDMEPAEEILYWEERKIKEGVLAPVEFVNTLRAVFSIKNSIGYCYRSQFNESVAKILTVE